MSTASGAIHYSTDLYARLYELERRHFWFVARNALIIWAIRKFAPPEFQRLLEIGCGTGFVLAALERAFPSVRMHGSEVLEEGLDFARQRVTRAELLQLDARALPYEGELDVVGAFDVLEHIDEDLLVLEQMHKSLKPGGLLAVTVPQHPSLWSRSDEVSHHVRRYTALELDAKVRRAGFEVLLQRSFISLLFPMLVLSRLAQRWPSSQRDLASELEIHPLVNAMFAGVCRVERWGIMRGLGLPFGGSLLLVARKVRA